jgi:RNA binding exosome subunit
MDAEKSVRMVAGHYGEPVEEARTQVTQAKLNMVMAGF